MADPLDFVGFATGIARFLLKPLGLWAKQNVDRHEALPNGFPRIAAFMASDPDHLASIYKRFNALNVRNLLLLEARVAALEAIQRKLDKEDAKKLQGAFGENFQLQTTSASFEYFALLGNSRASSDQKDPYRDIFSLDTIPKFAFTVWNEKYNEDAARWQGNYSTPEETNYDCVAEMEKGYFRKRWEVAKAIQFALKEYQEAVVLQAKMLDLENPTKRTTKALKAFLGVDEPKNDKNRRPVTKPGHETVLEMINLEEGIQPPVQKEPSLNEGNQDRRPMQFREGSAARHLLDDKDDLLSLHPPGDDDYGTRIVSKLFGRLLQRWGTGDPEFGDVSEEAVSRFTTIWTFLVAIGFLMGAVWLLWRVGLDFVSSDSDLNHKIVFERKLGITTAFTAVFGAWVAKFTSARRYEIFGATAAYAAVLIVFIGAAPGNT